MFLSSIEKFDGDCVRDLTVSEIKQIGGRAGRYGFSTAGEVGLLGDNRGSSKNLLSRAIYGGYEATKDCRISISPNLKQIQIINEAINKNDILTALVFFSENLIKNHDLYKASNVEPMIEICSLINDYALDINTKFTYCCAPVDAKNIKIREQFTNWVQNHAQKKSNPCPLHEFNSDYFTLENALLHQETYVKLTMLYRWLHYRYPEFYPDIEEAVINTEKANNIIEELLTNQIKRKTKGKYEKNIC